jgi:hypothetical protein
MWPWSKKKEEPKPVEHTPPPPPPQNQPVPQEEINRELVMHKINLYIDKLEGMYTNYETKC